MVNMVDVCLERPHELSLDDNKLALSEVRSSSTDSGYVDLSDVCNSRETMPLLLTVLG